MRTFHTPADLAESLRSHPLVLVQYGAESCAPCHAIRQRIDCWTARHPAVDSLYVSVPDYPEEAAAAQVFSVPTVLVFVQGKLTLRESGYFSLDGLLTQAERYLQLLELA